MPRCTVRMHRERRTRNSRGELLEQFRTDPHLTKIPAKHRNPVAKLTIQTQNPAQILMRRPGIHGRVTRNQVVAIRQHEARRLSANPHKGFTVFPGLAGYHCQFLQRPAQLVNDPTDLKVQLFV